MPDQIARLDDNCSRMTAALSEALPPALTQDALIDHMRAKTQLLKALTRESNALFATEIRPLLAVPGRITQGEEAAFFAVAQKLSSFTIRIDTGMALSIYQALLEKARQSGDRDMRLKYLYWCGITLFYGSRNREREVVAYFREGAAFQPQYHTIESAETRQYIHRCMGNYVMLLFTMEAYEQAKAALKRTLAFFNQLLLGGIDADFPWVSYFLSCMNHYKTFLTKKMHREPEKLTRDEMQRIFGISLMMDKLAHKAYGEKHTGTARYDMALWEAQLVSGQISMANFRENVRAAQANVVRGNYSVDALHANIMLPCYIMFYAKKLLPDDETAREMIKEQLAAITGYMKSLPSDIDPGAISQYISLFLRSISGMMPEREHFEWVVKLTTYRHKPTFAHAITVSQLTRRIAQSYIEAYPQHFVGVLGIERADQVPEKTADLLELAESCGLCHDVGKLAFLQNQTMYARTLSEDELPTVEEHVREGLIFFQEDDKTPWLAACLHVMEGHHVHYDGKSGYPPDFPLDCSPFKALVHMVTVADSLDSGTDDIGKVYADAKSLEMVVDEIRQGAGTRYSPYVARVLEDTALMADIADILDTVRQDAYFAAYMFAGDESMQQQPAQ